MTDETPESYLKRISQLPSPHDELESYLNQYVRRVKERVDEACMRALIGGKHGVKVTTNLTDGSILIEVSEEVPFGEIQYHTELGTDGLFGPY